MIRLRKILILLFLLMLTAGCGPKRSDRLRIAVNPWIGFTPLVYAQQKGWLEGSGIKFLWVVGLEEGIKLYRRGLADGFAGTQYEYYAIKDPGSVKPYFFFDRSFGADVILGDRPVEALRRSDNVDVYLEITGLNNDLLQAFATQYGLHPETLKRHASDPESLSIMQPSGKATLIIAYEPYATLVEGHGFRRLASTREITTTMVLDALWIDTAEAAKHAAELKQIKRAVDRAIERLQSDPKEYYETVKGFLKNQSYEEFRKSLEGIEWINRKRSPEVSRFLGSQPIPTDALIP